MTPSEKFIIEFDSFIESLCDTKISIYIEVEANISKLPVYLEITCNSETLTKQQISQGKHCIDLEYDGKNTTNCCIQISMQGKTSTDTVVHEGKIVKDTWIKIKKLKINNFLLSEDYDFFYKFFEYFNNDDEISEPVKMGFWKNSSLCLFFKTPFDLWYQGKTTKNIQLHDNLKHQEATGLTAAKEKFIMSLDLLEK